MSRMGKKAVSGERIRCGGLSLSDAGSTVRLAGWVDARRDHGDVLFVHLRDVSGIVQVVFDPVHTPKEVCRRAASLRNEYCIEVMGRVAAREGGTENPHIDTGSVEVMAVGMKVLAKSRPLPFQISEKAMVAGAAAQGNGAVSEDLRLQWRYLDLRRPGMQRNLIMRHRIVKRIRDFLDGRGFIEVETPMLTKSTPEGARDYLVPSRLHRHCFYALPQSPQLFKQLLMVGGMERYFQIARCFRDEDLRPNRQPEFTQLDLEASFVDEEFIYETIEAIVAELFAMGDIELPRPFPRLTWQEAIDTMGSDHPDTRFGLRFTDATDLFADTAYGIFRQILDAGGCIKGVNVKGQSDRLSKNVLQNEYAREIVPSFGARGMTWMRVEEGRLESNIVQFFSPREREGIIGRFGATDGDVIIMIADRAPRTVTSALGLLRLHLADRLGLVTSDVYRPLWITGFPLFEVTERGITSCHHPFTAPDRDDVDPKDRVALAGLRSRAYDLVINGEEVGGGSIRIHDAALQRKIFDALGLGEDEVREKFGFFIDALEYGAPPHGGIALGLDRLVSMILGTPSIRDVIAFPKNRSAACPLSNAPSAVSRAQLAEIGLIESGGGKWVLGKKVRGSV